MGSSGPNHLALSCEALNKSRGRRYLRNRPLLGETNDDKSRMSHLVAQQLALGGGVVHFPVVGLLNIYDFSDGVSIARICFVE